MSYLIYVAYFGEVVVIFLWLRDARIFFRTGLPGYRKAAYHGVLYGALGTFGLLCTISRKHLRTPGPCHHPCRTVPAKQDSTRESLDRNGEHT